jgi:two-component system, OmpR family, phosphate regulon response regulator PhoB
MKPRILVIEDQAQTRQLVRWTLEPEGIEVLEAPDGDRGLQIALRERPALIVLDVLLPRGPDGFEVCRRLKADPELRGIPVVLLTSLDRARERETGQRAGADAHLVKPFVPLELAEVVVKLLASLGVPG